MLPRLPLWSRSNIRLRAGATMDELLKQFWPDLIDRLHGPVHVSIDPPTAVGGVDRVPCRIEGCPGRASCLRLGHSYQSGRPARVAEGGLEGTDPGLPYRGGRRSDLRTDRLSRNSPGSIPGCGGGAGTVALPFVPRRGEPDHPALAPEPWTAGRKSAETYRLKQSLRLCAGRASRSYGRHRRCGPAKKITPSAVRAIKPHEGRVMSIDRVLRILVTLKLFEIMLTIERRQRPLRRQESPGTRPRALRRRVEIAA